MPIAAVDGNCHSRSAQIRLGASADPVSEPAGADELAHVMSALGSRRRLPARVLRAGMDVPSLRIRATIKMSLQASKDLLRW